MWRTPPRLSAERSEALLPPLSPENTNTSPTSRTKQDFAWRRDRPECSCPAGKLPPLDRSLPLGGVGVNGRTRMADENHSNTTGSQQRRRLQMLERRASLPIRAAHQSLRRAWLRVAQCAPAHAAETACSGVSFQNKRRKERFARRRRSPRRNILWRQRQPDPGQTRPDSASASPVEWRKFACAPPDWADRQRRVHRTFLCGSIPAVTRSRCYRWRPRIRALYDPASTTKTTPAAAPKHLRRPRPNPLRFRQRLFPVRRSTARGARALPRLGRLCECAFPSRQCICRRSPTYRTSPAAASTLPRRPARTVTFRSPARPE